MPCYLLTLSYDGRGFKGWQMQRKAGVLRERTVQGEVEKVLRTIPGYAGDLTAASRTDAGVHALGQTVSFTLNRHVSSLSLLQRFNALLPEDVAPRSLRRVLDGFNIRRYAKRKEYVYTVYNTPFRPVLDRHMVWWRKTLLNIRAMKQAGFHCIGKRDFKAFQGERSPRENTLCTIYRVMLSKKGNFLLFRITGDRFLYHMVRNIVGSLIEVGRGKITLAEFKRYLDNPSEKKAGPTAPARGLLLKKITFRKTEILFKAREKKMN